MLKIIAQSDVAKKKEGKKGKFKAQNKAKEEFNISIVL
jgi:hypothetical protein